MAKGNDIIVSSDPKGVFDEGIISGTPKPGTILEIKAAALVSGRPTFQAVTRSTGTHGPCAILLPDRDQGGLATQAYVDGTRCFVYWPAPGEEFNLLLGDVAGTGSIEDTAVGDLFGVEQTTGKIIANSSYAATPFQSMEARHGFITADALLFVKYLGSAG